jgi:hypothetical protein
MSKQTLISFRIPDSQIKPLRIKAAEAGFSGVSAFLRAYIEKVVSK